MASKENSVSERQQQASDAIGVSITLLGSVVALGLSFLINILLARVLGPDIKGRVDLVLASGGLAVMITGFSLTSGITFLVAQGQVNVRQLNWQLVGIGIIQGLTVLLILVLFLQTPLSSAFIPKEFISWGPIGISSLALALLLSGYGRAILSGLQRFVRGAIADILVRILLAMAIGAGLLLSKADHQVAAVYVTWATIAANFMGAALMLGMVFSSVGHQGTSSHLDRVWKYSLPSHAGNLVQYANYRLDVFLVAYFIGVRDVALYGAAVSIAQLLWLPSNAMQSVLFPRVSSTGNSYQQAEKTAQVMRLIFIGTVIGGIVIAFSAEWIVKTLFGPQFTPSLLPLWLILPGVVFFSVANVLCGFLAGIGKPRLNFYISLIGLAATLSLDFVLIPGWGISGAAIASSVSYIISAGLSLYFFMRDSGFPLVKSVRITKVDMLFAYDTIKNMLQKLAQRPNP